LTVAAGPRHTLLKAFVEGVIDNDEKVASSKKHTQFKTSAKTIPYLTKNSQNRYPSYD